MVRGPDRVALRRIPRRILNFALSLSGESQRFAQRAVAAMVGMVFRCKPDRGDEIYGLLDGGVAMNDREAELLALIPHCLVCLDGGLHRRFELGEGKPQSVVCRPRFSQPSMAGRIPSVAQR